MGGDAQGSVHSVAGSSPQVPQLGYVLGCVDLLRRHEVMHATEATDVDVWEQAAEHAGSDHFVTN